MVSTMMTIGVVVVSSLSAAWVSAYVASRFMVHDINERFKEEKEFLDQRHEERKRDL